ncbi:hypothetical protein H7198_06910, partial [Fructobacillus sp. CRL 2054]|nr:hypothetical protein [Fructobacillus sp. CRL 2054]
GRQGDANREVYFWLRDGKIPVDLSAKTIKLFAKDASGVVKETARMLIKWTDFMHRPLYNYPKTKKEIST